MLERLFKLKAHGVTPHSEIVAGTTVFFTMAYILFVNPQILSAAGMDSGAVFMATAIATALTTAMMGLYANLPVALAPGPTSPSPWCRCWRATGGWRWAASSCRAFCSSRFPPARRANG